VPPHAGHYRSLAVVRSKDNHYDIRVLELRYCLLILFSYYIIVF
jgi:hypothetical protein